jgi:hypothetical protein
MEHSVELSVELSVEHFRSPRNGETLRVRGLGERKHDSYNTFFVCQTPLPQGVTKDDHV